MTSADRLTSVQRARLAQERWPTCRHALLPPLCPLPSRPLTDGR